MFFFPAFNHNLLSSCVFWTKSAWENKANLLCCRATATVKLRPESLWETPGHNPYRIRVWKSERTSFFFLCLPVSPGREVNIYSPSVVQRKAESQICHFLNHWHAFVCVVCAVGCVDHILVWLSSCSWQTHTTSMQRNGEATVLTSKQITADLQRSPVFLSVRLYINASMLIVIDSNFNLYQI